MGEGRSPLRDCCWRNLAIRPAGKRHADAGRSQPYEKACCHPRIRQRSATPTELIVASREPSTEPILHAQHPRLPVLAWRLRCRAHSDTRRRLAAQYRPRCGIVCTTRSRGPDDSLARGTHRCPRARGSGRGDSVERHACSRYSPARATCGNARRTAIAMSGF